MKINFHFIMSVIKSCLRITACFFLMIELLALAGMFFLLAEIFGIIEEL